MLSLYSYDASYGHIISYPVESRWIILWCIPRANMWIAEEYTKTEEHTKKYDINFKSAGY